MPERKLSYKVDVDTGTAVRDLEKLGDAGGDAGKAIADGFDQAKSASAQALDALTAKLDQVEQDARGTASAVAAIKANLSVDVDDSKVEGFVSDLKNKMGVAFDQVEQDAKEFAAVLERGVDLSRTTNEIKGVGTALDTTRGEADQSRSVLANLAGNSAQSLGELGGIVGDLGVGVGQLAEYAVDGNIKLSNLAGVAGPMAGLAIAAAGVQSVMANIAATQAFNADQVKAFSDAFAELGDTSMALSTSLDGAFNVRVDDESVFGQLLNKQKTTDLADNLAAVGVQLSDLDAIIRSGVDNHAQWEMLPEVQNLDRVVQAAGVSVDDYGAIMEGVWETTQNWTSATKGSAAAAQFFGSSLSNINDQIKSQLIDENPFAVMDFGLYQTGGHLVDLQAIWNDVVRDMADDDASFDTTAASVDILAEAFKMSTGEVIQLAREQTTTTKATDDLLGATRDATSAQDDAADAAAKNRDALQNQADAIQAVIDKNNDMIDASHDYADSQQDFRDATRDLDDTMAETNATMANTLPGMADYDDALRTQRDTAEDWVDGLAATRVEYDKQRGVMRTAAQTQHDYAEGLGVIASHLNADVIPAVAAYYAAQLQIPDSKLTEFEMVLAEGDQEAIETFVTNNSGTKKLAMEVQIDQGILDHVNSRIQAVGDGASATVVTHADTGPATSTMSAWRKTQANTPVYVTIKAANAVQVHTTTTPGGKSGDGVSTLAAGPTTTTTGGGGGVVLAAPATPSITVNLSAGVVGNRYDLQRWLRAGLRDQQRLGRIA